MTRFRRQGLLDTRLKKGSENCRGTAPSPSRAGEPYRILPAKTCPAPGAEELAGHQLELRGRSAAAVGFTAEVEGEGLSVANGAHFNQPQSWKRSIRIRNPATRKTATPTVANSFMASPPVRTS